MTEIYGVHSHDDVVLSLHHVCKDHENAECGSCYNVENFYSYPVEQKRTGADEEVSSLDAVCKFNEDRVIYVGEFCYIRAFAICHEKRELTLVWSRELTELRFSTTENEPLWFLVTSLHLIVCQKSCYSVLNLESGYKVGPKRPSRVVLQGTDDSQVVTKYNLKEEGVLVTEQCLVALGKFNFAPEENLNKDWPANGLLTLNLKSMEERISRLYSPGEFGYNEYSFLTEAPKVPCVFQGGKIVALATTLSERLFLLNLNEVDPEQMWNGRKSITLREPPGPAEKFKPSTARSLRNITKDMIALETTCIERKTGREWLRREVVSLKSVKLSTALEKWFDKLKATDWEEDRVAS